MADLTRKQRLEQLISYYSKGNKAEFARRIGVTPQTISTWLSRDSFDLELVYSKCEEISGDWLLSGGGEMLFKLSEDLTQTTVPPHASVVLTSEREAMYIEIIADRDRTIEKKDNEIKQLNRELGASEARRELEADVKEGVFSSNFGKHVLGLHDYEEEREGAGEHDLDPYRPLPQPPRKPKRKDTPKQR